MLRIEDALAVLTADKEALGRAMPLLPDGLVAQFTADSFVTACNAKFGALDKDGSGNLTPDELYPVVLDLADAETVGLTLDH